MLRLRLWSSYEVLEVPARDIAREQVMDASGLKADALVAEYVDVHTKAKSELDETWRIVRPNLEADGGDA
jgi:hypothetical protein